MYMRLAKRIAMTGLASRRTAEQWIREGRVAVDRDTVLSPACVVSATQTVYVDGVLLPKVLTPRLWRYYKPRGLLVTRASQRRDSSGKNPRYIETRPTIFDHLPPELSCVLAVGRLDLDSEGLLLLTTSGDLVQRLLHPSAKIPRVYRVRVFGTLCPQKLVRLEKGCRVKGITYQPIKVAFENSKEAQMNRWITCTLQEGKNREIRKLLSFCGGQVNRLIRTHFGPFKLAGLVPGDLEEVEVPDTFQKDL